MAKAPATQISGRWFGRAVWGMLLLLLVMEAAWLWVGRESRSDQAFDQSQALLYDLDGAELVRGQEGVMLQREPGSEPEAGALESQHTASDAENPNDASETHAPESHDSTAPAVETHAEPGPPADQAQTPESATASTEKTPPIAPQAAAPTRKWHAFARPANNPEKLPTVSILMTGLGLSRTTTEDALTLPPEVSLSFSPYAMAVPEWVGKAKEKGFEVWLDVPLEPEDYPLSDPGPYGLLSGHGDATVKERLDWLLARAEPVVGLVSAEQEKFTQSEAVQHLLSGISARERLYFRASNTPSEPYQRYAAKGVEARSGAIELDQTIEAMDIQKALDELVKKARQEGSAVAICRPYPVTVRQIRQWAATLASQGVILVPASAAIQASAGQPAIPQVAPVTAPAAAPPAGAAHH